MECEDSAKAAPMNFGPEPEVMPPATDTFDANVVHLKFAEAVKTEMVLYGRRKMYILFDIFLNRPGSWTAGSIAFVKICLVSNLNEIQCYTRIFHSRGAERVLNRLRFQERGSQIVLTEVDTPYDVRSLRKMACNLIEAIADSDVRCFRVGYSSCDSGEDIFRKLFGLFSSGSRRLRCGTCLNIWIEVGVVFRISSYTNPGHFARALG